MRRFTATSSSMSSTSGQGEIVASTVAGQPRRDDVTVYKSLGNVAQDLVTAAFACEQAAIHPVPGVTRVADFG